MCYFEISEGDWENKDVLPAVECFIPYSGERLVSFGNFAQKSRGAIVTGQNLISIGDRHAHEITDNKAGYLACRIFNG